MSNPEIPPLPIVFPTLKSVTEGRISACDQYRNDIESEREHI